uniref:pilus assembly FimT family protein n=1 Tax=Acetatifactor sp. TaxID=1872090 RepID=UPI004056159B
MRQDQRGFSLVELIVVIAIMAVVSTVGVLSFAMVTGRQVISCTEEMESYIAETKVQALSRASATLEIFVKADGVYVNLSVEGRDVKIGTSGLTVKYRAGGSEVTLSETERLVLSFDRASGAFLPLSGYATETYCEEIVIESGNRTGKIVLVSKTGKFYIEE